MAPPERRGLEAAVWASQVLVAATIDAQHRIIEASPNLESVLGVPLSGQPAVKLVADTQADALLDAIREADTGWTTRYLGIGQDADGVPLDYVVRLGVDGDHVLFVGEPAIVDSSVVSQLLLTVNDDLVADSRDVAIDRDRLDRMTTTDPLTMLGNRRRLSAGLDALLATAAETLPISVVFTDIDHFKSVNDTFGHPAGDAVLRFVADILTERSRASDLVTRYGGEEFVVVLPATDVEGAARWAERTRATIAEREAPGIGRPVTASFGVAQHLPGEGSAELLARADAALYTAKKSGRDRVARATDDAMPTSPADASAPVTAPDSIVRAPRLSEILWQSAGIGVAEFGSDDRIVGANIACVRLLGGSVVGRTLQDLVAATQSEAVGTFLAQAGPDWARGTFGLVQGPDSVPIDRILWLRRSAEGLDLIVDVDTELLERTETPLLALVDDLVATQRELTRANRRLQTALDDLAEADRQVGQLRELVPVCAWCQRLRVDEPGGAQWLSMEQFLARDHKAVTHSICPTCAADPGMALRDR